MVSLSSYDIMPMYLLYDPLSSRASTLTHVNGNISCFAINVYKIDLPFKQTLACEKRHGLLISSSNEKDFFFFQN